ncbi:unnamed protein product [Periconia digitata]|uniref:Uncharacterized protein n=1 Tax=Periconia digitata TaxID=1303443 RepID=A0A9W4XS49_9PLEO|nr:unnamed protein product [Periconia digitata]
MGLSEKTAGRAALLKKPSGDYAVDEHEDNDSFSENAMSGVGGGLGRYSEACLLLTCSGCLDNRFPENAMSSLVGPLRQRQ